MSSDEQLARSPLQAAKLTPGTNRGGAAARLRMVRRAARVLELLEDANVYADVETASLGQPPSTLRTDLIVQALDLRIRIALVPGGTSADIAADPMLSEAIDLLMRHAETAAVAVVADDERLSTRIYEPFDSPSAIEASRQPWQSQTGPDYRHRPNLAELGGALGTYLRQVNPGWSPPNLAIRQDFALDRSAGKIGQRKLLELKKKRKVTPEWRTARADLSTADADWIAMLSIDVIQGKTGDVLNDIKRRARDGRHP